MKDLKKLCKKYFGKTDLYAVLGVDSDATEKELRRGYRLLSLKIHPDRVPSNEKDEATEKFKVASAVHLLLTNAERRTVYDETVLAFLGQYITLIRLFSKSDRDLTPSEKEHMDVSFKNLNGRIETEDDDGNIENWKKYWFSIFKEVTDENINEYELKYKGSDEELEDLKKAYIDHEGDMDKILEHVLFSSPNDEPRFTMIIRDLINKKEVSDFSCCTLESPSKKEKRKKRYVKEAKLVEKMEKKAKLKTGSTTDLVAAIKKRQEEREGAQDDFIKMMEAKYSKKPKSGRKQGKQK